MEPFPNEKVNTQGRGAVQTAKEKKTENKQTNKKLVIASASRERSRNWQLEARQLSSLLA